MPALQHGEILPKWENKRLDPYNKFNHSVGDNFLERGSTQVIIDIGTSIFVWPQFSATT